MKKEKQTFPRGAEWRQWDFHVHTPASFQWKGKRFSQMSEPETTACVDSMIKALNESAPIAFVLMDYWTFDGWFILKKRLGEVGAPKLTKKVFPGIELRLVSPTTYRLNAHVVFSDDVSDQDLKNFKAKLEVALINQPLSDECLVRLAKEKIGDDLLRQKGFNPAEVKSDDSIALMAGSKVAEITSDSYKKAIEKVPGNKAIGFMPWEPNDGLAHADWKTHYAFVIGLMNSSPIFETRRQELWAAFAGIQTDENKDWLEAFQSALDNIPRLAVSGSDAHSFNEYGKFPHDKKTWIKADPTFFGLLQSIKEPAKRSFIGQTPSKMEEVLQNKTFYINSVKVTKNVDSPISDHWLADCNIPLNTDLVAIIGNKGSGKSALADIIALLGNSRQKDYFSFLSNKRFRQKPKHLARHFTGSILWCDQTSCDRLLSDDPPEESVELVRYIPQAHFERLCNEHVSGQSDVFEKELRAVIFSHTNASIRQKAHDFEQLIEQQESSYRDRLADFRKDLKKNNSEIEFIEAQLQPEVKLALEEHLTQIQKQIDEHKKIEPRLFPKPSEQLTSEQQKAAEELDLISKHLKDIEENAQNIQIKETALTSRSKAIQVIKERLRLLERNYKQFLEESSNDFIILGLDVSRVASLSIDKTHLDELFAAIPGERSKLSEALIKDSEIKQKLLTEQSEFRKKLNEPQQLYQQSLKSHEIWQKKLRELEGTSDAPETLAGIKSRISQLNALPDLLKEKQNKRLNLTAEIFDILDEQRRAREELFKPVQELIQNNSLIRDEYKLQFQATLVGSADDLALRLFELIKQNSGEFRGEDESRFVVKKIAEQYDLNKKSDTIKFVTELHDRILAAARAIVNSCVWDLGGDPFFFQPVNKFHSFNNISQALGTMQSYPSFLSTLT